MVAKKKRQNDPHNDSSTDSSEEKQQGSCSHVNKAVDMTKLRKVFKTKNVFINDTCSECTKTTNGATSSDTEDKTEFAYDKTLWLCLNCGTHLCGRSKNKHAILHNEVWTYVIGGRIANVLSIFCSFFQYLETTLRFTCNSTEHNNVRSSLLRMQY